MIRADFQQGMESMAHLCSSNGNTYMYCTCYDFIIFSHWVNRKQALRFHVLLIMVLVFLLNANLFLKIVCTCTVRVHSDVDMYMYMYMYVNQGPPLFFITFLDIFRNLPFDLYTFFNRGQLQTITTNRGPIVHTQIRHRTVNYRFDDFVLLSCHLFTCTWISLLWSANRRLL